MKKKRHWMIAAILIIICGGSVLTSCSNEDNPSKQQDGYAGVPIIILDTDIGSSTDDLFAMEMLYHYMDEGKCKFLGVVVDREGESCAACADVMNNYFGYPNLPIGLERNGIEHPYVWIDYNALPTYKNDDGTPMFKTSVSDYSALPDGYQLYRSLLAGQPDHSVTICSPPSSFAAQVYSRRARRTTTITPPAAALLRKSKENGWLPRRMVSPW